MSKNIEKKQVIELQSLVDYTANSIARQEVLHSDTGSATVFAFDAGQGFGKHTAPFDVIIQIIDGEGEIMIEDELFHPHAGEILIIPKGAIHAVTAVKRFKMLLTKI